MQRKEINNNYHTNKAIISVEIPEKPQNQESPKTSIILDRLEKQRYQSQSI